MRHEYGVIVALVVCAGGFSTSGCGGSYGVNGRSSLLVSTPEPAGANCLLGGTRLDVGMDQNGDGLLDAEEIESTSYVCQGGDGTDGATSLVSWSQEPAGANCPEGGYRVDTGVDDSGDGVLDTGEIDSTVYLCHGADGAESLVAVTTEPMGANCPSGGQKVEVGLDDDADGVLDADEIHSTTYVCHGGDGATSLVSWTAEPAGAHCASGGQKVDSGVDDDADGVLDAGEVESTVYVCNGADGVQGTAGLVAVTPEPAGTNCPDGGQRVDSGLDDDGDRTLDATEVDQTSYVCDGAGGMMTLVSITPEPSGTSCPAGGQRVETGIDDNANGTLEAGEVLTTVFVCDGEAGSDGVNGLVAVTAEPSGTNCLNGGQKLETGLDIDADGVLDATEVESTVYVCDGEDSAPNACTGTRLGAYLYLDCDDGTRVTWYVGLAPTSGHFADSGQDLGGWWSISVGLEDLDGDGDLDAFVANYTQPNRVWWNDGSGIFTDSGQSLGNSASYSMSLGDLDGDGDQDAFVVNYSGQGNRVWLNDGSGGFSDSGQSLGSGSSLSVSLGDVDGDGDLDALVGNHGGVNRIWLNDGNGLFSDSGQSLGGEVSRAVILRDLDGDGDLDAFEGNDGQGHRVWLNDGSGVFSDSGQILGSGASFDVSLGDVDGDGDLDAYVANHNQGHRVWLNDGNGVFNDSGQSLGNAPSWSVVLGDVDGDGDLDACVANDGQGNQVWLNDGSGIFSDSGQILGGSSSRTLSLGDVDGDGDLDAYFGNFGLASRLWLNQ